jgi:hypothetical protein
VKRTEDTDEWGRDPQVHYLRSVFRAIEAAQRNLLEQLAIPPFDERLRRAREGGLHLFERGWVLANRKGIGLSEEELGLLYVACLERLLTSRGIHIPENLIPSNEAIAGIMKELPQ